MATLLVCMVFCSLFMSLSVLVSEPFILGGCLISCALFACSILCKVSSSVFSLMVFMSYVSGLMVLFLYVLSVHPNQIHSFSCSLFAGVLSISCGLCGAVCWVLSLACPCAKLGVLSFVGMSGYWKLYLLMGVALLYTLLVVCFLCNKKRVPFRSLK
nr:NADH dehydrogenase subunit 6 [Semimytilus algosus]